MSYLFFILVDSTKLGVWVLDGDATHTGLLKYALTPENFKDSLIVVTASMSQPWSILKSITNWLNIITDHIDRIGIAREAMEQCQQKCKLNEPLYLKISTKAHTSKSSAMLCPMLLNSCIVHGT